MLKPKRLFSHFARSPLFATVKRALHLAHLANQERMPNVSELVEQVQSRRQFLKQTMATAATVLMPAVAFAKPNKATMPKIVIVGGGIAGLNAAYQLKKAGLGWRADVYEATARSGGRIYTLKDVMGAGLTTELGGEFIDSNHREIHALVKEFQLPLLDFEAASEDNLKMAYFFGGTLRSEAEIVEAFRPLAARIKADYNSLDDLVDFEHASRKAIQLDNLSLAEYLEKIGATGWVRKLLEVTYLVEYGLDCEQQSALNFIDMSAPGLSPTEFNVWGDSDGRYQIKGGNNRLIDELTQRLDGQIHYLYRMEALQSKGTGYRLTFENPNGNAVDIDADVVILTIPFSVLRQVALNIEMPPVKKRAIAELGYGTITKMMAGVKQRTWRARGYNGDVFTEDTFQQAYDNSRQQNRQGEAGGITFYLGGRAGTQVGSRPEVEIKGFLKGLDQVFPRN